MFRVCPQHWLRTLDAAKASSTSSTNFTSTRDAATWGIQLEVLILWSALLHSFVFRYRVESCGRFKHILLALLRNRVLFWMLTVLAWFTVTISLIFGWVGTTKRFGHVVSSSPQRYIFSNLAVCHSHPPHEMDKTSRNEPICGTDYGWWWLVG